MSDVKTDAGKRAATIMEKPILFNDEMIRAILDNRKTQTRRPIKPQPEAPRLIYDISEADTTITPQSHGNRFHTLLYEMNHIGKVEHHESDVVRLPASPFGGVGDLLWVRECWCECDRNHWPDLPHRAKPPASESELPESISYYRASFDRSAGGIRWRPSIHMPRWASRITLRVTDVRAERLQDVTEKDAYLEGAESRHRVFGAVGQVVGMEPMPRTGYRREFKKLWQSIYSATEYNWDANPWVLAYEFELQKKIKTEYSGTV